MQPAKKKNKRITSWHLIGAQLAMFRKAARMTQATLAERCAVGDDTIASIEQGRRALQWDFAGQLDELLDTKGALRVAVEKVPKKELFSAFVQDFVDYEQEALTLFSYQDRVVPGLLQTKEYARFLFACEYPPLEEDQVEEWLAARLERQRLLERRPRPVLHFILEESILRGRIGDPAMLRVQIAHLRRCMELPFLGLQIMPMNLPKHAGLTGPMVLLETPDHDHLAYVEGQLTSYLHDDPDVVSVLQQKCGMLRSQALSVEESARLLDELLGER
ncbi:helix-turn-helix domain-containing protein [Streptomyces sp. NBC_00257]|uniref:helix-turn-helix domain-containing protein n=1 Tax=unclassified Streptomyces TaxID=2593676 RepID=UPI002258BB61|nr:MULTISPECIES: helix-turn-helix transcriptional regulator [unclassified Streptomyces]WTB57027.1 helix-turn-helix domain-containing protein [Streptomyces sp. NBC_00826]WTH90089.1 helix-turn-helix domain-containing protein [Streptomyces sp. NBC_00825]WTH98817.1 helix-turn-helix domain-containing protein [Streptomyces sp. NBC_00822]MCX4864209.1 helix-turn-helix domain-containing protein [Streptomyces sp. NBC_00906]MCX4895447.1 helix-turn-helix domain-containing protein [Streptomyces sp. NBC_008